MKINIGLDFGRYPAGRYLTDGPYNGQKFREQFLMPALQSSDEFIDIVLSDARGMKSSFLEETFGGLVRAGFRAEELIRRLRFESRDPTLVEEIHEYIRKQAKEPVVGSGSK